MRLGRKTVRIAWATTVLAIMPYPAIAAPPPQMAAFEKAMASTSLHEATDAYQSLLLDRAPSNGVPVADATLDAIVGRLGLESGDPAIAIAFLSTDAAGDETNISARKIALGEAYLALGRYADAEAALKDIGPQPTAHQATRAALARAATMISRYPAQAIAIATPLTTTGNSQVWRAWSIIARAEAIRGNSSAARSAADKASLSALDAPVRDYAPLIIAQVQAAIAAQQQLPERVTTMLMAVPQTLKRNYNLLRRLGQTVPACGARGLLETDSVVVAIMPETPSPVARPVILAANRPEVAAVFEESLAGLYVTARDASLASGPIAQLRCRNGPASPVGIWGTDPGFATMLARNHLRPLFLEQASYREDDPITDAAVRLERFETKAGRDSLFLALGLSELAGVMLTHGPENPETRASATMMFSRSYGAYGKLPAATQNPYRPLEAPENMVGMSNDQRTSLAARTLAGLPLDAAYGSLANLLVNETIPASARLQLIDGILPRFADGKNPEKRANLMSERLSILRQLRPGDVPAYLKTGAFNPQICQYRHQTPRVTGGDFSARLFPASGLAANIEGISTFEVDVDAKGKPASSRAIVQSPPLVFDEALKTAAPTMTFDPARDAKGQPAPCRAVRQNVRWQQPSDEKPERVEPNSMGGPGI